MGAGQKSCSGFLRHCHRSALRREHDRVAPPAPRELTEMQDGSQPPPRQRVSRARVTRGPEHTVRRGAHSRRAGGTPGAAWLRGSEKARMRRGQRELRSGEDRCPRR